MNKKKATIAVIGAGVMGQGVAYQFAKFGYQVSLVDTSQEILEQATRNIRSIVRMDILVGKTQEPGAKTALERIKVTTDLKEVSGAGFIVENVTENVQIKEKVYAQLRDILTEDDIVAVNTSAIPITIIGSQLRRPENVLGIHFMNPVHMKPTVEMIQGHYTSEETLEKARQYLGSVKINSVLVNDSAGFVSNRILMLTINEAIFTLQEGVATVENIDKIFRDCFGHKMGPLETGDLIGLDTILFTLEVLFDSYLDSKFRPAPLLRQKVNAGLLGRKSGEGFYKY